MENLIEMFIFKISIFYFFSALLNASADAKKCAFFPILDLIRPILSETFKNDSSLINISIEAEYFPQQEAAVCRGSQILRFSGWFSGSQVLRLS